MGRSPFISGARNLTRSRNYLDQTATETIALAASWRMCGIHAAISRKLPDPIFGTLEKCLRNRGPDHFGTITIRLGDNDAPLYVALTSTVLALRGKHTTAQPLLEGASGSALCWNGEAWKIHGKSVNGNDGEVVLSKLTAASPLGQAAVLDTLRAIEGPFAFIFLDKPSKTLYYGRDALGGDHYW